MIKLFSKKRFRQYWAGLMLIAVLGSGWGGVKATEAPVSTEAPTTTEADANAQESADTSIDVADAISQMTEAVETGIMDKMTGGTGLTFGDLYASMNDVDGAKKTLNEYLKVKYITAKDYYATVVGMYLSQYAACMQGNLLNVVQGLEENLSDDDLNVKLMVGNTKDAITVKDALTYIKSNYRVAPLYKGNEEQNLQGYASLRDLYEKEATALYLKDINLKIDKYEVANTANGEVSNEEVSGGIDGNIPGLSYQARNSDQFRLNKLTLSEEEKSYCVFNSSSACRLALQLAYSELERYNGYSKDESMWQQKEELLSQGLYMDSFGNIVAMDKANKQYTIIINCLMNPTICEIGSNEKLNMEAYGINQVYSSYNANGGSEMSCNYDSSTDSFEYRVALGKNALKRVSDNDGGSDGVATKWVTNLLGARTSDPQSEDNDYLAVFSFATDEQAKKDEVKSYGDEKIKKPKGICLSDDGDLGTSSLSNNQKTSGGEYSPMGGFVVSVTNGEEGAKDQLGGGVKGFFNGDNKVQVDISDGSLVYIRTNHNRATEAYYGYKSDGFFGGKNREAAFKGIQNASALGRNHKLNTCSRGNMGDYTVMPIPTSCLFFGIGDDKVTSDSNVLKFDFSPRDNDEEVDMDVIGYYKDYVGFYSGKKEKLNRYIGFLYTPKTYEVRGKATYVPQSPANPSIKNIDADTILLHLRLSLKCGILRKANITNLGRKADGTKKAKGFRGYAEATAKLIEEANTKIKDHIDQGFDLDSDSPINGVKYKKIWAIGLDIYGDQSDLMEQCKRSVVVHDNMLSEPHTQKDYNTVEWFMAVTKNTCKETVAVTETGELSAEAKAALKEEKATDILDRVYEMLNHPITTFVKMVSGFLQWIHTGISSGTLASFFYITDKDVSVWLGVIPQIVFYIAIAVLMLRMGFAVLKYIFDKNYGFKELSKNFIASSMLMVLPGVMLTFMRFGISYISDKGMNDSTTKIEAVYLNKQLVSSTNNNVAAATTDKKAALYFIEHFEAKREAEVSIQVLNTSKKVKNETVNPNKGKTSKFEYTSFNLGMLPTYMSDLANKNAQKTTEQINDYKYAMSYDGQNFCTVFGEYYKQSVFFYFLDYYMNEWCLLNGKSGYYYELDPNWATTMCEELTVAKGSFRNYYNRRAIVYGPSSGLTSDSRCVDDIFGLGMLFYAGGKNKNGKLYPLQIYDSKVGVIKSDGSTKDKTKENGGVDLWNGYKHGNYFIDTDFIKGDTDENKEKSVEDIERLGNQKYNMAYGAEVLAKRAAKAEKAGIKLFKPNQLVASEAIFEANGIDKKYSTKLERAIWEVNNDIYSDVMDYFDKSPSDTCDFTDIVMLASISTFRFNNKFGQFFGLNDNIKFDGSENGYIFKLSDKIKPISFDKDMLDMDVIMKAIYAGDKEVKAEYDMMYYLGTDTFGVVSAVILIVAEIFVVAYVIIRMVHLVVVYLLATVVCAFSYGMKRDYSNKAWLGTAVQAVYFLVAHLVLIFMLNLSVCNDMPRNGWTSLLFSLLLLLGAGFSMAIEIKVMLFLITNIRDLGGQLAADKLNALASNISGTIKGKLKGKFEGDMKSERVNLKGDIQHYGNDDDEKLEREHSGGSELLESMEQADKVRGKKPGNLGEVASSSMLGVGDATPSSIDESSSPGGRSNMYQHLDYDKTVTNNTVNMYNIEGEKEREYVVTGSSNSFETYSMGDTFNIDNSSSDNSADVSSVDVTNGINIKND